MRFEREAGIDQFEWSCTFHYRVGYFYALRFDVGSAAGANFNDPLIYEESQRSAYRTAGDTIVCG